jgi:hypothetical protein
MLFDTFFPALRSLGTQGLVLASKHCLSFLLQAVLSVKPQKLPTHFQIESPRGPRSGDREDGGNQVTKERPRWYMCDEDVFQDGRCPSSKDHIHECTFCVHFLLLCSGHKAERGVVFPPKELLKFTQGPIALFLFCQMAQPMSCWRERTHLCWQTQGHFLNDIFLTDEEMCLIPPHAHWPIVPTPRGGL